MQVASEQIDTDARELPHLGLFLDHENTPVPRQTQEPEDQANNSISEATFQGFTSPPPFQHPADSFLNPTRR